MTRETGESGAAPTRHEAAQLLREARAASPEQRSELAGWSFLAVPDSLPAARLYIRTLLESHDTDKAEALIAQTLLRHPTDPGLALLRALALEQRRDYEQSLRELELALTTRPHHAETLDTAARIASRLGRHDDAARFLGRAHDDHPDPVRHERLVNALLRSGQVASAAEVMSESEDDSALLHARLMRAEGRLLEAVDLLERSIPGESDPDRQDRMLLELVELLEAIGDTERLCVIMESIDDGHPLALARGARAMLDLGEFETAGRAMARLASEPAHRREALTTLLVASALRGRLRLARKALHRLSVHPRGIDRRLLAECWRRGLIGRVIRGQSHPATAGADPSASVLQPLLEHALEVFEEAETSGKLDPDELERHRETCRAVLGLQEGEPRREAA